jgi:DNA polymerase elongation subunit (family B)
MTKKHKEGIEDAFNILYNNCFDPRIYDLLDNDPNPEEYLIKKEAAEGKDPKLSTRAQLLIEFAIEEYPKREVTPTEIFKLAQKEMRWTARILKETIKEARMYARSILR